MAHPAIPSELTYLYKTLDRGRSRQQFRKKPIIYPPYVKEMEHSNQLTTAKFLRQQEGKNNEGLSLTSWLFLVPFELQPFPFSAIIYLHDTYCLHWNSMHAIAI